MLLPHHARPFTLRRKRKRKEGGMKRGKDCKKEVYDTTGNLKLRSGGKALD